MFTHPEISRRMAEEHRAELLREAARYRLIHDARLQRAGQVSVQVARPGHRTALADFLRRLSPETRYGRFFALPPEPTAEQLDQLLRADAEHRAVVAVDDEAVIGHAMASRSTHDGSVEVAVVVSESRVREPTSAMSAREAKVEAHRSG
jgi:predicted N-acetyltransferase YhbS